MLLAKVGNAFKIVVEKTRSPYFIGVMSVLFSAIVIYYFYLLIPVVMDPFHTGRYDTSHLMTIAPMAGLSSALLAKMFIDRKFGSINSILMALIFFTFIVGSVFLGSYSGRYSNNYVGNYAKDPIIHIGALIRHEIDSGRPAPKDIGAILNSEKIGDRIETFFYFQSADKYVLLVMSPREGERTLTGKSYYYRSDKDILGSFYHESNSDVDRLSVAILNMEPHTYSRKDGVWDNDRRVRHPVIYTPLWRTP